jgi:hypothetical protein
MPFTPTKMGMPNTGQIFGIIISFPVRSKETPALVALFLASRNIQAAMFFS